MSPIAPPLASAFTEFLSDNRWPLGVAAAIVLVGLLVFGFNDVRRFSWTRTWAIASVCFRQSIRRKVLWITPLVILGIVVVSQWQQPLDAQDAIRQTTAICLFATGMLVTLVTIIVACTNLPKDIESRVIFTVATKPTTRLEIILGKVIGFARLSFWILLIMGLFTWGYLRLRDWQARKVVAARIASLRPHEEASRPTLQYYLQHGTLHARTLGLPEDLGIYAREPRADGDYWLSGGGEIEMLVRFEFDRARIPVVLNEPPPPPPAAAPTTGPRIAGPIDVARSEPEQLGGLVLVAPIIYRPAPRPAAAAAASTSPATAPATRPTGAPTVTFEIQDRFRQAVVTPPDLGSINIRLNELPRLFTDYTLARDRGFFNPDRYVRRLGFVDAAPPTLLTPDRNPAGYGVGYIVHHIPQDLLDKIAPLNAPPVPIYVTILGGNPDYEYTADPRQWFLAPPSGLQADFRTGQVSGEIILPSLNTQAPIFGGRLGQYGDQLRGGKSAGERLAIFRFRGQKLDASAATAAAASGAGTAGDAGGLTYPFELRVGAEPAYDEEEDPGVTGGFTRVQLVFVNRSTGQRTTLPTLYPENNRPLYFQVPASAVAGGDFDVHVRLLSPGWLGVRMGEKASLKLIRGDQPFSFNLAKSLLVLWLLSILVTVISVFASTFLSWPIAVVLTAVILSGRWGAMQIGDFSGGSVGRQVWETLGGRDARAARAFTETVDSLVKTLEVVTAVLPDLSAYAAIEHIERGVAVPASTLLHSLAVTLSFGLPLAVLAFVFLKFKEVAP